MIEALDMKDGIIVSGGRDFKVKVWDTNKKQAVSLDGHGNWVQKAMIWD